MSDPLKTGQVDLDTLERIHKRVLWLAVSMVHHANHVRPNPSGIKVGGHQASSASISSVMTALYFNELRRDDLVSVKPHASPVLHAINFLLGRLDRSYMTELREFGGLQSYPSRNKDPDPIDFSTGSVGIGATATIWSAVAQRYVASHFDTSREGRHIALVGDGELDEGAVWEALLDPLVSELGEILWIVDLNRQSLDRVVPNIGVNRLNAMFAAAGWQTLTIKYGRALRAMFAQPGGDALEERIDTMDNEEYQRLLRAEPEQCVARLCEHATLGPALRKLLKHVEPSEVSRLVRDLAGHDMADITDALRTAPETIDRPTVLFTYTLKAWGLPTVGHPSNHSSLLSDVEWRELAPSLDADPEDPWAAFAPDSAEGLVCKSTADRLERAALGSPLRPVVPPTVSGKHPPVTSTQQSFGRLLNDLARSEPELASRIVTVSPDVASSTNLGGWINRVGVWHTANQRDWFADDSDTFLHWNESKRGQHIALGIAETNLVGLLGELGATWSRNGEPLIPIGTIYDPFVARALEPWSFGIYGGGRSILVGTPSGISLSREGGAHQSVITPSIGIEQPMCTAWEPCFARDLEWTLLYAMQTLVDPDGTSSYFRLSTKPIDQGLSQEPENETALEQRRRQVLAGGYLLRRSPTAPDVVLVATGVVVPETVEASEFLTALGVSVDVICITSADLLFRATRAARGVGPGPSGIVSTLFPRSRRAPIVTVIDGHPHTLAFLGATHGAASTNLGVDRFGEVGDIDDLYRANGIDASTIAGAAFDLLDAQAGPD